MTKALTTKPKHTHLEQVLIQGDLAPLSELERINYVKAVCRAIGVSILFRPFDFIKFQGKVILYANRSCTDQLRKRHKVSIRITDRKEVNGVFMVTADASMGNKTDSAIGAISVRGKSGDELANAVMKCETKAKRRVTLSICGLGMLDEIEIKEIAAREAEFVAEAAVEATTDKLELQPQGPSVSPEDAPAATGLDYKMKSGRHKGKMLKQIPLRALSTWWTWYNSEIQAGKHPPADIEADALEVGPFLISAQTAQEPDPAERGAPDAE